jgi:threonine 3-dehydrogenase
MKAVIKAHAGAGSIILANRGVPEIKDDQVLIKVTKAGICGTDFHIYSWDKWSQERIKPPLVIGHEFAGVIEKTGPEVRTLTKGQRVSAEGHIVCRKCRYCASGQGHICDDVRIIGVDRDGCFAEYIAMPEYNVWPLGDHIEDRYGAIMDPLGNAMHTVAVQQVKGRNVLITGAGSIGLFAVAIARKYGASRIIVSEPNENKRRVALRLGADKVIDPVNEDARGVILEELKGEGPDVVLEMSGIKSAVLLGLDVISKGGDMAVLGIPSADIPVDFSKDIIFKGITIRGVNGRRMFETWQQCDDFLKYDSKSIDPVITHEIPLEDINKGFEMMSDNRAIKVLLNI